MNATERPNLIAAPMSLIKNPYSNMLFCSICGAPMFFEARKRSGGKNYVSYVCGSWLKEKRCSRSRVPFAIVDNNIRQSLQQEIQLAKSIYLRIGEGRFPQSYYDTLDGYQHCIDDLIADIQKDADAFQLLRTAYCDKMIDSNEYLAQKQSLNQHTRDLDLNLQKAMFDRQSFLALFSSDNPWLALYQGQPSFDILTYQLAKRLIERVQVSAEGDVVVSFMHQRQREKLMDILEG